MSNLDTSKEILKYFELETNRERSVYFEKLCKGFVSSNDINGLDNFLDFFSNKDDIDTKIFYEIYNKVLEINNITGRLEPNIYNIKDIRYDASFMPGHLRGLDIFNILSTLDGVSEMDNTNDDYFLKKNIRTPFNNFKFLTVFSCDERYFDLFYDGLYTTFMKYKHKNEAMFINVLNPRLDQIEFMKKSFDSSIGFSVSYTKATQNLLAFSTCLRYLTAKELMDLYDCPILVSEMDTIFKSSPYENFLKEPEDLYRIVCMNTPGIQLPWQKYLASFTLIRNTEIGKNFLNDICKIINYLFNDIVNDNYEYWYIDQNILLYLFRTLGYERENNWGLKNRIHEAVQK